jgi:hypothetical protein
VAKNTDEVLSKSEIIKKEVSLAEKIAFLTTQDNLLKKKFSKQKSESNLRCRWFLHLNLLQSF